MCGPEGFKHLLIIYDSAFPDLRWTTEEVAAQGETVVARLLGRGTHQRELMGMPPTGKHVTWTETHIFRVAAGKLVEHWTNLDQVSMLQQFGVPHGWIRLEEDTSPEPCLSRCTARR